MLQVHCSRRGRCALVNERHAEHLILPTWLFVTLSNGARCRPNLGCHVVSSLDEKFASEEDSNGALCDSWNVFARRWDVVLEVDGEGKSWHPPNSPLALRSSFLGRAQKGSHWNFTFSLDRFRE